MKGISLKVNATSDMLVNAILWPANSTDTDFRNEESKGKSLGPNGGEFSENSRMYVVDSDEGY